MLIISIIIHSLKLKLAKNIRQTMKTSYGSKIASDYKLEYINIIMHLMTSKETLF